MTRRAPPGEPGGPAAGGTAAPPDRAVEGAPGTKTRPQTPLKAAAKAAPASPRPAGGEDQARGPCRRLAAWLRRLVRRRRGRRLPGTREEGYVGVAPKDEDEACGGECCCDECGAMDGPASEVLRAAVPLLLLGGAQWSPGAAGGGGDGGLVLHLGGSAWSGAPDR